MTIDTRQSHRRRQASPRFAAAETLKSLPPRRPVDDATNPGALSWELVDILRYRVFDSCDTVGFIDVVGAVYVVLEGERYDRAVEVAQTLLFDAAIAALAQPARKM
ncbi:hypothetical protein AB2L57_03380 [Microbacterium sp. HA-8]|uniref:hypothetical protein n=1 Tax=unclassified Microbacterium TaxID=2609290 RepID=UPI0025D76A97|nr:hypothetical protein [Microbacterium sp.]